MATLAPSEIVPWWVSNLFEFTDTKSAGLAYFTSDSTSLGVLPSESIRRYALMTCDVQALHMDKVLNISVDQGYMYFELERTFKANLLRAFGTDQWSNYQSHLLSLVVLASADCYIEPSWSSIQSGLGEVIESTVLPFFTSNKEIEGMIFEPMYETISNHVIDRIRAG